ncbi:hypothetical protein DYU05_05375 [Mucilaginibacter terrenus]|uniref:Uncharacterized protein n=1 Tax=Mucilaginibacter terrenus TaxID=2482727 RepID=A0A3E2NVI9_9SPHI|nr:hypothetical protein [Mucilaginibacter terrenus]RFZ85036.1 hypothetical protein DYU05_05375 [Mucilaginibacter terrenus]
MKLISNIIALILPDAKPVQIAAVLAIVPLYIKAGISFLKDSHRESETNNHQFPCYMQAC